MARKAVKKAVKRAATVKKQFAVAWSNDNWDLGCREFITGIYDTLENAKKEAENYCDDGDTFFVYEVKLVAQSERAGRLTWKGK